MQIINIEMQITSDFNGNVDIKSVTHYTSDKYRQHPQKLRQEILFFKLSDI